MTQFLLALVLLTTTVVFAGDSEIFDHPNSLTGNAGWDGALEMWLEIGDVDFGGGNSVPLRLGFSSSPAQRESVFGACWWCPLLEATAHRPVPNGLRWRTLGGGHRMLVLVEGSQTEFATYDGKAAGRVHRGSGGLLDPSPEVAKVGTTGPVVRDKHDAHDPTKEIARTIAPEFLPKMHVTEMRPALNPRAPGFLPFGPMADNSVILSDGWIFRHERGKIQSAWAPSGERFFWRKSAGGWPAGIFRSDGEPVIRVVGRGPETTLVGNFGEFSFKREETPNGQHIHLKYPDGRREEIRIVRNGTVRMEIQSTGEETRVFRWDAESGQLLSDNTHNYEWREEEGVGRVLVRTNKLGGFEWYHFDNPTFVSTLRRSDGSRVVTRYQKPPGPAHLKPLEIEVLDQAGKAIATTRMEYAGDGTLRDYQEKISRPREAGPRIDYEEAVELHNQPGVLFLDARRASAFERGHIPGALNLSQLRFERDFARLEDRLRGAKTLVVYCDSIRCEDSGIVAVRLASHGLRDVRVFGGGWAAWWRAEYWGFTSR